MAGHDRGGNPSRSPWRKEDVKFPQLLLRVKRTIDRWKLLEKGDRVIVGVSAGVDSMVLLHLFNALRQDLSLSLIVAHLNHGIRPREAVREFHLVQNESLRLNLPFEYQEFNAKEFQKLNKISLQEAARQGRFRFFQELQKKYSGTKIALGHHADDQVETLLLGLFRGSGLQGLKGMLPIRSGGIIRPLLETWKEEIESVAHEHAIPFLTDSSNLKMDYLRNRLRLYLIPLIEKEFQKGFRKSLLKTSILLRDEDDFIAKESEKAYEEIAHKGKGEVSFNLSAFQSLHPAIRWRVIQRVLERTHEKPDPSSWDGKDVKQIVQILQNPPASFLVPLSRGAFCEKRYEHITFHQKKPHLIPPFDIELKCPGRTYLKELGKEIVIEACLWEGSESLAPSEKMAFLDYDRLQWPLRVRNFRPGDRFQPLGFHGTQKLKDFFIDHKIPKFERPGIPLLISGNMIAWIIGYRIGERFRITPNTKKALKIELL